MSDRDLLKVKVSQPASPANIRQGMSDLCVVAEQHPVRVKVFRGELEVRPFVLV